MSRVLRDEYPRPDWVRKEWASLNGEWEFAFDDEDQGLKVGWAGGEMPLSDRITVPFPYQSGLSGVGTNEIHPILWYKKAFHVPSGWQGKRILLHFGAVDYTSTVWVNGAYVGNNQGGYVPFSIDITDALADDENRVVVQVVDTEDIDQPRGKQSARVENWGCWYTRVSGIWQSVWLEPLSDLCIDHIHTIPDIDASTLTVEYELSRFEPGLTLELTARRDGRVAADEEVPVGPADIRWADPDAVPEGKAVLTIPDPALWSPEKPNLYDMRVTLKRGDRVLDQIETYFGMRKISAKNGRVLLNNEPCYHRMILDQGYWPDGIYTPPDARAFEKNVRDIKAFGFNGVRKHQKIEDPYFYYYCDRLGLLVWEEMPSPYNFSDKAIAKTVSEWQRAVRRDYNHPSIVAWVPVNESWGFDPLRQSGHTHTRAVHQLQTLYHLTKALDPTRLCISNDGWEHATTDIVTIHEYTQVAEDLSARYRAFKSDPHGAPFSHKRSILLPEVAAHEGRPIMMTEFGGCKVASQGEEGWGYGEAAENYGEMVERIRSLVAALKAEPDICGYCYTQLTDVEQEVNGLMTADHKPKVDPGRLRDIFGG